MEELDGSILPPQQIDELMTFIDATLPGSNIHVGYGLGIMFDDHTFGETSVWHSGGTLGYSSIMVWLRQSNVIITVNLFYAFNAKNR